MSRRGNARILVTAITIAIAFSVGRLSTGWFKSPDHVGSVANAPACEVAGVAPGTTDSESAAAAVLKGPAAKPNSSSTPEVVNPAINQAINQATDAPLKSRSATDCLTSVGRRDVAEWLALEQDRMEQFHKSDSQFASRGKMSAGDWARTIGSGDIRGDIKFKFDSAVSAEFEVLFKDEVVKFSALHRNTKSATAGDQQTHSTSSPLRNGYGIGFERDGSGYHIVFENPVDSQGWVDYSNFGFAVPLDWDRKSQITVDVFGLREDMKWSNVASARLKKIGK